MFPLLLGAGLVGICWWAYAAGCRAATDDARQVVLRRGDTVALPYWNFSAQRREIRICRVSLADRTAEGHLILQYAELRREPAPPNP